MDWYKFHTLLDVHWCAPVKSACHQPVVLWEPSKATPAPPVGPAIGAFGLNIAFFVKERHGETVKETVNELN